MSGKKHSKKPIQVQRVEGFAIMPKHGFTKAFHPHCSFADNRAAEWKKCNFRISVGDAATVVPVTLIYYADRVRKQNGTVCPKCGVRFGWEKNFAKHLPCEK